MRVPEEAATLPHQPWGTVPGHWNAGLALLLSAVAQVPTTYPGRKRYRGFSEPVRFL